MSETVAFLILCLGPFVGSFLGVLVDRLPRGENVVMPRSACRGCGRVLGPRDLIPVLSYALARGRCSSCKAAIPPYLLYLELGGAGMGLLAVLGADTPLGMVLAALWLWTLLGLLVADLIWFRLPDLMTGALLAVALSQAAYDARMQAALVGAMCGAGSFALLRWGYHQWRGREGLGMGDVKLMAGLGAWAGIQSLPMLVLLAALTALAVAAVGRLQNAQALNATRALPFGAALCASAITFWLIGQ